MKRVRYLSGNADELLLELILGCGVHLQKKWAGRRIKDIWAMTIIRATEAGSENQYHLALDLRGIRGPVNKHNFVARVAISGGVPERRGERGGGGGREGVRQKKSAGNGIGGGLLEVIHAISAIVVRQHGEELGVGRVSRAGLIQTNLSVLVVDFVDEEAATVLWTIQSEHGNAERSKGAA